jgi:hypothetical protein
VARTNDIDLMMLADGELTDEEARELARLADEDESVRAKLDGLEQVGEMVRSYHELAADDAADAGRFDALWQRIEEQLQPGAAAEQARATQSLRKKPGSAQEVASEPSGLLAALRAWFRDFKGHVATGAVTATAVAVLFLVLRPYERERVVTVEPGIGVTPGEHSGVAIPHVEPVRLESEPPDIENLEIYDGSGMILTIPGDEDDGGATVIWLSNEEDAVEGPI